MIDVLFYEKQHRYAITVTGHAEYAPHGQDIVCAAASALMQAFGFYLIHEPSYKTFKRLEIKLDAGDMNIEYLDLKDRYATNFEMLLVGMESLADTYPGFIKCSKNIWQS